jgi:hypothetical protein
LQPADSVSLTKLVLGHHFNHDGVTLTVATEI